MKYVVKVEENFQRHFIVDAVSDIEAHNIVEDTIVNEGLSLDYDDHMDTKITVEGYASKNALKAFENLN